MCFGAHPLWGRKHILNKTPLKFRDNPVKVCLPFETKLLPAVLLFSRLFSWNYRYCYRLEIRTNSFNYHYRYRLGVRSHPFISIGSRLPSWKSLELICQKWPLQLQSPWPLTGVIRAVRAWDPKEVDFFSNLFWPRGQEAPRTFFRLFWDFGPEGPEWTL